MLYRNLRTILTIGLAGMVFIGCGVPQLTQDEAESVIRNWYPQKSDAYSIALVVGVDKVGVDKEQLRQLEELKKIRLIDYKIKGVNMHDPTLTDIQITVTDKGKPYFEDTGTSSRVKKILLVSEDFDQVTGITQQGEYAQVQYTTRYEPMAPFTRQEVERLAPGCLKNVVPYTIALIKEKGMWKEVPMP